MSVKIKRNVKTAMSSVRVKALLKERSGGTSFPFVIAITLSLLLIFCGISEYFRMLIIAQGVRDVMQSAVISQANDNYQNVYHSVRQGYSGAYQPEEGGFSESIDYGDLLNRMDERLGLFESGGFHEKRAPDGSLEFCIWDLKVEAENPVLAAGDDGQERFAVRGSVKLLVPVTFAGKSLAPMQMTVKVAAGYIPRF